jgi:propionate CoA-transferase
MRRHVISADEATRLVQSGDTVVTTGLVGITFPEAVAAALERRFLEDGEPRDLCMIYGAGQGDGQTRGMNHFAHEGMVRRVIGGHWGLVPGLGKLALENKIEAYNFPQGVIIHLLRDIAAGKPGTVTHVGLGTFVDPQQSGGRINTRTTENLVERVRLADREWLFYRAIPINVAIVRGTTADPAGNVTMEREAMIGEVLAAAHAARNSGGKVICQVERLSEQRAAAQDVRIPGNLIDAIVVADPEHHHQTFATKYNPLFSGETQDAVAAPEPMPLDARKIIARRALLDARGAKMVNLGIGVPEGVACVAVEEGIADRFVQTVESGVIGGVPAGGLDFGAAADPLAMIDSASQFDFYDGGGIDLTYLGAAQIDAAGNVNVSRFGSKLTGIGGFVNISQNAKRVIFCGTFTAGGLQLEIENGAVRVIQEGRVKKFLREVEQISFSGKVAVERGQRVTYVTERAVFTLTSAGFHLIEIAPGVDMQRDVLAHMGFEPLIEEVRLMDDRIFRNEVMGLADDA